jgi:hypothetical protein
MKSKYQIYLFAAALIVAIGFFIQRSFNKPSKKPLEMKKWHKVTETQQWH